VDLSGLELAGYGSLSAGDKWSSELDREPYGDGRTHTFVVEFHRDVPRVDRRLVVTGNGLDLPEHPGLTSTHLLVTGTREQVRKLAEWDEVAYIFPAGKELLSRSGIIACEGAANTVAPVGQLTARLGEGWDGPGLNEASLTYSIQSYTQKLSPEQIEETVVKALAKWSAAAKVQFLRTSSTDGPKNVNIVFGRKDHGDPYPFDGPGGVLAHTFYPADVNPEPIAGDMHLDEEENWNIGKDIDLLSVVLHELGHALGLGHSDVPGAVMYPYYRISTELTPEDVSAIQSLYAPPAPATPPAPPVPIVVQITAPASQTTILTDAVNLSGTASGVTGTPEIKWSLPSGVAGLATGTMETAGVYRWNATVPLSVGVWNIRVTATEGNRQGSANITVQRITLPSPPPEPPPTPPVTPSPLVLTVDSPGANVSVTSSPIPAQGTVRGASGAVTVRWSNDRGGGGSAVVNANADGSYKWSVAALPIQAGINNLVFTAGESSGRSSSRNARVELASPNTGNTNGPVVRITQPNTTFLMTNAGSLAISGTASHNDGVAKVTWECTCGASGNAQGTSRWVVQNVSLAMGLNTITVTATDANGNRGSAKINIHRR
jgi:hypothetical protein